jgi:hypothetical protein
MSKTVLRKIYAYSVTIAGFALGINRIRQLPHEDVGLATAMFIATALIFASLIAFGASVEPGETSLKVSQYREVELDYSEIRACYRYIVPPFEMALIITRRRFPLCCLIAGDGVIGRRSGLIQTVRERMKQL